MKSVTSNKLRTFQMDVTNSQQIREVYEEVERRIPSETGIETHSHRDLNFDIFKYKVAKFEDVR